MVIFETERLRLETWGENAVPELMKLHGSLDVVRFLDATGTFYDRPKAEKRLAEWDQEYRQHGIGKQRLVRRNDGAFLGRAGYSLFKPDTPEIGYSLLPEHWGNGYATEIAAGLRDWLAACAKWSGFIGFAHVDNVASKRVLERIGMKPTYQDVISDLPMQFYAMNFGVGDNA